MQRSDIARFLQHKTMHALGHDFAGTIENRADHRHAHRQTFQHHETAWIMPCRKDEKIGRAIKGIRVVRGPGKDHAIFHTDPRRQLLVRRRFLLADDQQYQSPIQTLQSLNGFRQTFALKILRDDQTHNRLIQPELVPNQISR